MSALPDICENRHGGAEQSVKANERVHKSKEVTRNRILKLAEARGDYGVTVKEIAAAFGTHPNCVSGRVTELRKANLLVKSGKERGHSDVHVIPKGQRELWPN